MAIIAAMLLLLLSPARPLDDETPAGVFPHTLPQFSQRSAELAPWKPQGFYPSGHAFDRAAFRRERFVFRRRIQS